MSIQTDSIRDPSMIATMDIERKIQDIDEAVGPLRKAQKKLQKIEEKISNTNFLIDSGIGSCADKAALRETKRELRQQRIQLWKKLEALPALVENRKQLVHELDNLRRRHGIL